MSGIYPGSCALTIRQQPKEALVALKGKEKMRKPVDPPPIIELTVDNHIDPGRQFLQNPYLFVSASLYNPDRDEPLETSPNEPLTGALVSSLHRLRDTGTKDSAFFIFGDISVKVQGSFRLCFTLCEFLPASMQVQHLASMISDNFEVVAQKDFKGLAESTYLSRIFSDQGVRLRLRKEPRGMMSNKRSYPMEPAQAPIAPLAKKGRTEATNPPASIPYHPMPEAPEPIPLPYNPNMYGGYPFPQYGVPEYPYLG